MYISKELSYTVRLHYIVKKTYHRVGALDSSRRQKFECLNTSRDRQVVVKAGSDGSTAKRSEIVVIDTGPRR